MRRQLPVDQGAEFTVLLLRRKSAEELKLHDPRHGERAVVGVLLQARKARSAGRVQPRLQGLHGGTLVAVDQRQECLLGGVDRMASQHCQGRT